MNSILEISITNTGNFKLLLLDLRDYWRNFQKMPGEDKTLYLLGKSYLELDQWEKAREAFTKIVNEYPKSLPLQRSQGDS